jgi:YVTN family beta-propeller protein
VHGAKRRKAADHLNFLKRNDEILAFESNGFNSHHGAMPDACAAHRPSDDRTALVVQKGDHSVGFYALPGGHERERVPVDPFPHELALCDGGRLALVTHFGVALAEDEGAGGNTVSVIDVAARRRVGRLDCGEHRRPHGIAVDGAGRVLVLSEATSRLLVFDKAIGGSLRSVHASGGRGSHMVTVTRSGDTAFCSNMRSGTVSVIDLAHDTAAPVAIDVGARPEAAVLDADEQRLYVVNRESGDIAVIDVATRRVCDQIVTGAGPVRLCWANDGTLLVALYHARELVRIDPSTRSVLARIALPGAPISIAFDAGQGVAYLSTLDQEVVAVDVASRAVSGRFATRADPDPVALV